MILALSIACSIEPSEEYADLNGRIDSLEAALGGEGGLTGPSGADGPAGDDGVNGEAGAPGADGTCTCDDAAIVADALAQLQPLLDAAEARIDALEAASEGTQADVAAYAPVLDLLNYVTVDPAENAVVFSGANVFVQNGELATATNNALGNLIVGYDEDDGADFKLGSHNIVVGPSHSYSGIGSIVGGENNASMHNYGGLIGGSHNTVSGSWAAAVGSHDSFVSTSTAVVVGGSFNTVNGENAVVVGNAGLTAELVDEVIADGSGGVPPDYVDQAEFDALGAQVDSLVAAAATVAIFLGDALAAGSLDAAISEASAGVLARLDAAEDSIDGLLADLSIVEADVADLLDITSGWIGSGMTLDEIIVAVVEPLLEPFALDANLTEVEELMAYVDVNPALNAVRFVGANVFVQNGSVEEGSCFPSADDVVPPDVYCSDTTNGTGNLIVGYNEKGAGHSNDRDGSHNIVVGWGHEYRSFSGFVQGSDNQLAAARSAVLGGSGNVVGSPGSVIVGGSDNVTVVNALEDPKAANTVVVGGSDNTAGNNASVVLGGSGNRAAQALSAIVGGLSNATNFDFLGVAQSSGVVLGGRDNVVGFELGTVAGGTDNLVTGDGVTDPDGASVFGGTDNTAVGAYAVVSGGKSNIATSISASVFGGESNAAGGEDAGVYGGIDNVATFSNSAVFGGFTNKAQADSAVVVGGEGNEAKGNYSLVTGGLANMAAVSHEVVP